MGGVAARGGGSVGARRCATVSGLRGFGPLLSSSSQVVMVCSSVCFFWVFLLAVWIGRGGAEDGMVMVVE